jgi:ceramide glucosyltransferase
MELFWFFACISIAGLIGFGFQIWSVRAKLNTNEMKGRNYRDKTVISSQRYNRSTGQPFLPPISILKPLKGLDDNLFDNLESLCIQDYPCYEIIFSLQDHNDPACKVAMKIKEKYPDRDITVLVKRCNAGLNPKVNNLIPAQEKAKYEYILVSDSNVMVDKNYLKQIVKHMEHPEVGLVSNMIQGVGGRSFGAIFENLHMNSFVIGSVCFLEKFLKMPCVVGKSMLMRKRYLESIGGFMAVKDVLAEDYIIGKKMKERGKRVILSNYIIKNVNEYWGIRKFLNRHTRWGKLRWRIGGMRYISELLTNAVFMAFLPLVFWEPARITISFAMLVSSLKVLGDLYLGSLVQESNRDTNTELEPSLSSMSPLYYLLSPIKDLIIGVVWFIPLFSNTVVWRGNRYIISKDSALSPHSESRIWLWRYRLVAAVRARFA